jgi:hypothetical protein
LPPIGGKNAGQKQAFTEAGSPAERTPPNNPELPMDYIEDMQVSFAVWRDEREGFAAHLNGVGLKKLGFIGRALQLVAEADRRQTQSGRRNV